MYNPIFKFELKSWLKSPLFYFISTTFFLFSLVSMLGTGGYFDGPVTSTQKVQLLNSAYAICLNSFLQTKLLLFVAAVFVGFSLYKDYRDNIFAILYSYPITKAKYLNGKLGSALFLVLIVCLLTLSGIFLGAIILGVDNPKIGTNNMVAYLTMLCFYQIPALLIAGILIFMVVGMSRNIFAGFIVVICFVLFQSILENTLFHKRELLAILDPFGQNAFRLLTLDWNIDHQNSTALPIGNPIIINRIFWLLLTLLAYAFFKRKFELQYDTIWQFSKKTSIKNVNELNTSDFTDLEVNVAYDFSTKARFKAMLHLMVYDFKSIVKNWMFLLLSLFGIIAVFFMQLKVCNTGDFNFLPITRIFIGAPLTLFTLIIILNTFLFTGLLVNKSRLCRMNLILDATPVKNWQMIAAMIGAISLTHLVQLLLFLGVCHFIQLMNGYHNFELGLYVFHLFVLVFPVLFVWNVTSHFVHSLVPNLFLGLFLLGGLWLGSQSLDQFGIDTHVLRYNSLPRLEYTDFDGYGYQLKAYLLLMAYWLAFGLMLVVGIAIIWNRGSLEALKDRIGLMKSRVNILNSVTMLLLVLSFCWMGFSIYVIETKETETFLPKSQKYLLDNYKKEWEPLSKIQQPKIENIDLSLDLFPEKKSFKATGTYRLVNTSDKIVDTLFIRTGFDEITELSWQRAAQLLKEDTTFKSNLYKLANPMLPGDSINLNFSIKNKPNSIFSRNSNVLTDGSYLKNDMLPRIGFQFIERALSLDDSLVNHYNYYHRDADYVNIKTKISTRSNQIAIGPGELIEKEIVGDRSFYTYNTPNPVKVNFSFHSARFKVLQEDYHNIKLELYYTNGHNSNAGLMMSGLKASIDFNTKWFGQYPYKEIRIIEFPHTEETYSATLTTNNIPTSELLFNINKAAMDEKINLPFYVIAHELTHEWFGNQVMPADAVGAKMLTESITEYITLCIYRKHLGDKLANNFLDVQKNRYNRGKKKERGEEQPLYKVLSNQEYIAYGKGAVVFDKIASLIGRDRFHSILREYILKYKNQLYYPTTRDFMTILKVNTSTEEFNTLDDWLTGTKIIF